MITLISKEDIEEYVNKPDVLIIDLVSGAFAPPEYVQELWLWGLGATKYSRDAAKKRLFNRWVRLAKKAKLVEKAEGKDIYIATKDGTATIYVGFFEKFLDYAIKNRRE